MASLAKWAPFAALAAAWVGARAALAAPIKVACIGDSITQDSGWSDKLRAGYTSTNFGVTTTTLLKNGDTPNWNTAAFTRSHSSNPDIVVIVLGTNDSKPFNWSAHKGEFVGDYEALVDTCAALPGHPRIFLNLCPPAGTNSHQIDGAVIENEILPDFRQVAAAKGLTTIDVFSAFGGHNLDPSLYARPDDLVHPNAKGAQVIADTVYAALLASFAAGGADAAAGRAGADASTAPADDAPPITPNDGSAGGPSATSLATGTAGSGGGTGVAGAGVGMRRKDR